MNIKGEMLRPQREPDGSANQAAPGDKAPEAALDSMPCAASHKAPGAAQAPDLGVCRACGSPTGSYARERLGRSEQLQKAISRWENEGGADGDQALQSSKSGEMQMQVNLTNAELVQLQIRVIALENLVVALFAGAADQTPEIARAMASYISPRLGCTPHHLTIHAAAQMMHLVKRSTLFRV